MRLTFTFYVKIAILAGVVAIGLVTLARLDSVMENQRVTYVKIDDLSHKIEQVKESIENVGKDAPRGDLTTNTTYSMPLTDEELDMVYMGEYTITHYCACSRCCGKTDGITATGTKATEGRTIAVDPQVIPYGTEVIIDGHEYIAEDCGGAIKGNRIDIFCDTHQEAINRGKITREVYLRGWSIRGDEQGGTK